MVHTFVAAFELAFVISFGSKELIECTAIVG